MGFKLKALVAAVALAAVVAPASAAVNDVAAAAGSDLFLFAINSDGASFVQDLGVQADNFTGAASQTWTAGSAYTSFVTATTDATSITWGVAAAKAGTTFVKYVDSTVQVGADTSGLINGNVGTVSNASSGMIHNVIASGATAFANAAGTTGYYTTATTGNWNYYSGSDFKANYPFATDNFVGTTGVEFMMANLAGAGAANTAANQTPFAGTFGFDGTSLNYTVAVAAVPEPETYGMLAAGLLMLGAVARRRKA